VVGAELTVEPSSKLPGGRPESVALLAMDHGGYRNLCALLTAAHEDHEKGTAGVVVEQVAAASEGLVAVVPVDPPVAPPLPPPLGALRRPLGARLGPPPGPPRGAFAGAPLPPPRPADARLGPLPGPPPPPPSPRRERKPLADILHCIRHKTTLDAAG